MNNPVGHEPSQEPQSIVVDTGNSPEPCIRLDDMSLHNLLLIKGAAVRRSGTNYALTLSNLPRPGRLLGKPYSVAGHSSTR